MTAAFQVHNGPISSDAKFDICPSDAVARKGTHARWPLIIGYISFLSIFEIESACALAGNKFVWLLVWYSPEVEVPIYSGILLTTSAEARPGFCPKSLSHLCWHEETGAQVETHPNLQGLGI